jgi:thymidylate synthase
MDQFSALLSNIEEFGHFKGDRTGTGTQSYFGQQHRFSLRHNNLPVVTGKFTHVHSVEHELFWMISGDTKVGYLIANGVRIWNEWVKPHTAAYEFIKHLDLFAKLEKRLGKNVLFVYSAGQFQGLDVGFKIHAIDEYLKDLSDQAEQAFWQQYPDMTQAEIDSKRVVVEIDVTAWAKTIGGDWAPLPAYLENDTAEEFAFRLHRLVFGADPKKLVGGDLGAVYGKTWRDIEDTRVIPKLEWQDYEARGFTFVVDVPGTSVETDRCVVTRRIDQLQDVINQLTKYPDSRRIIICAWAPQLVDEQALPPCHAFIQFWTRELTLDERIWALDDRYALDDCEYTAREGGTVRGKPKFGSVDNFRLQLSVFKPVEELIDEYLHSRLNEEGAPSRAISCQLYQRSADSFLGVPFNITFYSLFTHMLANQFNMVAEEFIWTGGDTHIYNNHREQVAEYHSLPRFETPTIQFKAESRGKDVREITQADYEILNYVHGPRIAAKVAV